MQWCLLVLSVVLACSSGAQRLARPQPTIELIAPGAEPRERIRYAPPLGATERVETSIKLRVATTFTNTVLETGRRNADYPTIILKGRLEVTGTTPAGDALVAYVVEDASMLEDVVDPAMLQAMGRYVARMKGIRGSWRMTPIGMILDADFQSAPGTRGRYPVVRDSLDDMALVFPDAPIGLGASWQVTSRHTRSGITSERKATYTLRELTEGQAIVDASIITRAPSQALRVEPNATTTLKSASGSVTAQLLVPRRGLAVAGSAESRVEINLSIVRKRLRITSTVLTETWTTAKRLEP